MRGILLFLLFTCTVMQSQQFDKKWQEVLANENQGKIKSASVIVNKIYKKAVQSKNEEQIIKCFFYKSKYLQVVDENAQAKIIENLQFEIKRGSPASKALLNLVLAKCLQDYQNKNGYLIGNRTNTIGIDSEFLTWSQNDFQIKIATALEQSLTDENALLATPIQKFAAIFDLGNEEQLENKNVLNYAIQENIATISKTLYNWEIDKKDFQSKEQSLLGKSVDFLALNFDSIKNKKLKRVLHLFQKQEKYSNDLSKQLERIQFFNSMLLPNNELYAKALNTLQRQTKQATLVQKIQLEKAILLNNSASKTVHPEYNIQAISLLDSILKINNRSNAYKQALQRKQAITEKSLYLQLQKFSYSNENTRAFITYTNTDNIKVSFYKVDQKILNKLNGNRLKNDSLVLALTKNTKPQISKNYRLEDRKNYFNYTTEIVLPPLPTGRYLVFTESETGTENQKAFAYETITLSNLSVLGWNKKATDNYQVLNRKTGKPIANAIVESPRFRIETGKNGIATYRDPLKKDYGYSNETLTIIHETDTLQVGKNYISSIDDYSETDDEDVKGKVEFYLDRAIYRPGQTVFYKGIAVQKSKGKTTIVPKTSFSIVIEDTNNSTIKEIEATTNEFGSFSGSFVLPASTLTGTFRILAEEPDDYEKDTVYNLEQDEHPFWDNVDFDNSQHSFQVEEYKRPKFEVTFEPIKKGFELGTKATVTGQAKAFSGSNLSNVPVKYTVQRSTQYQNRYYGDNAPEIVATSETTTDASGKFNIDFTAIPPVNAIKEQLPVFNYNVTATVTDSNGETHSATTNLRIGYHDLVLNASLPAQIETKNKNEIILSSTNLNGQFVPTQGEIKLYFIRSVSSKFKDRIFPQPEIQSISDGEFERLFPFEKNEKVNNSNSKELLLHTKEINTEKDKKIVLDFISKYQSGFYKIVFSAVDHLKNKIETTTNFKLIQSRDILDKSKIITAKIINNNPKKDGFVKLQLQSVIPELFINVTGNYHEDLFFEKAVPLQNNQAIVTIPFANTFENSVIIGLETLFENQIFTDEIPVELLKETKSLAFNVATFRDKLQPGTLEKWSFQLKANNNSQEAEILASMYDRSLDQFTYRNWEGLNFTNYTDNSTNFKTSLGFEKGYCSIRYLNPIKNNFELDNEDLHLLWFGFNFNDSFTQNQQAIYRKELNRKSRKPLTATMISGIVTDGNEPLPGVSITINGLDRSTQTDFDGYYQIEAATGESLTVSFIGFKAKTIIVDGKILDIQLEEEQNSLEEVVVVSGYGSVKSKALSAAVTIVEADNNIYNAAAIDKNLQGKVAGLAITSANDKIIIRGAASTSAPLNALCIVDGIPMSMEQITDIPSADILNVEVLKDTKATALYGEKGKNGVIIITTKKALEAITQVKARTNLSETAFFYPHLQSDAKGKVQFSFTSPEALTAWKLRLMAHNKEAVSGFLEKTVVTQKELMVTPNLPRFFREKDSITITAKIANITKDPKVGIAIFQLYDATNMQPIDLKMANNKPTKDFTIAPFGNTTVSWKIYIPEGLQGVQYKILAKAGDFSDGEENIVPVLTNNMLVTESIPVWVRDNSMKEYTFTNLKNNISTTLKDHQFTFEYTSNPTWLAIQSLLYLMEYEHECAEQTFARFYANALATNIINSNPKIAQVFDNWRQKGTKNSPLETNETLKSIILAETPWLRDATSEEEKKQRLATLFDLEKMKASQEATFDKLKQKQKSSGGFAWFDGSDANEYITRHIVAGLGHLQKLSSDEKTTANISTITKTAVPYLDQQFLQSHDKSAATNSNLIWRNPYTELHYLYSRSFFLKTNPTSDTLTKTINKYLDAVKKDWLTYSLYEKGLAALTLNRFGEQESAKKIIESLKETASNNEDWGMYWVANKSGWYWYQAPIETQALLIEAFTEVTNDKKSVDDMKVWLLKNKQTKNWPTTKSTTEAIYALLMQGTDWLSVKDNTVIKIGDETILTKKRSETEKEAETGYLKLTWKAAEIKKEMANISIQNKSNVPGYGGIYWQYFEDLDQIKSSDNQNLTVLKELYLSKDTANGKQLNKITTANPLQIGDLVTVRLVINAKESMEFVHLKDMRASCFEPTDVLSTYQYKGGLGFYQSTKDAATHFFFDKIDKGTYVLEYTVRVNNKGDFSNGISTIQSMYAPEYSSHTKGIRVIVKE